MGYDGSEVITGSGEWRVRKCGGNNAVITLEEAKVSFPPPSTRDGPSDEHSRGGCRKEPSTDGARVASIAIDKAITSAERDLTTRKIGEMAQPGQPLSESTTRWRTLVAPPSADVCG
jgi:hypothetical protein